MFKFFFILGFLLIIQDEPVMVWSNAEKLTWNNFKDNPTYSESAVALTASGISFSFSLKQKENQVLSYTTEVYAHFYPDQSWYKKEHANAHILGHEQLHFDITELYARKFRQYISELKISNNLKYQLKEIHVAINKELKSLQNTYDLETDYSRNYEQQAKWQLFIDEALKKVSKYK